MITPTDMASHIASQLDGDYDDGIDRKVTAQSKGTIIALDLSTVTDDGDQGVTESFIIAVISAPVTS